MIALPSTGKEGLPNVLLEALAMEKPCVATNKCGYFILYTVYFIRYGEALRRHQQVRPPRLLAIGLSAAYSARSILDTRPPTLHTRYATPPRSTRRYGMPEVVIDGVTGYVFPSGDVGALAESIVKIGGVSAEEQAAMAKAGKEMVFAEHDKVKQFEKILEIIKEKARSTLA